MLNLYWIGIINMQPLCTGNTISACAGHDIPYFKIKIEGSFYDISLSS